MTVNLSAIKPIAGTDVAGKRVLLRLDLNVPIKDGGVTDTTRLSRILPTLQDLSERGAKTIILSHLGRPKGHPHTEMSLKPIAKALEQELPSASVHFADECVGETAYNAIQALQNGSILLLENIRFHAGEEQNDPDFAKALAELGDLFVNDAFSVSHRAHTSTAGLAGLLPKYAGPSLLAEIQALTSALETPKRPVAALVGGAKVSTKIPVLTHLIEKVDKLIIGGGMANTFLFAQDIAVGKSLCEPDFADLAKDILAKAQETSCEILLPIDAVIAGSLEPNTDTLTVNIQDVPNDKMILDVGPQTLAKLTEHLHHCKTLLWNGPLGAFEIAPFGEATFSFAKEAARLTQSGEILTIAGGGDTVAALNQAGVSQQFSYISTAGGAFLEWLEGKELPGIAALTQ